MAGTWKMFAERKKGRKERREGGREEERKGGRREEKKGRREEGRERKMERECRCAHTITENHKAPQCPSYLHSYTQSIRFSTTTYKS